MSPRHLTPRFAKAMAALWAAATVAGILMDQVGVACAFCALALSWGLVASSYEWAELRFRLLDDLLYHTHVAVEGGTMVALRALRKGDRDTCEKALTELNMLATSYTAKVTEAAPNGDG